MIALPRVGTAGIQTDPTGTDLAFVTAFGRDEIEIR